MASLKRNKSIDCLFPTRNAISYSQDVYHHELKASKSCSNIKKKTFGQDDEYQDDEMEWENLIPSMINSWVKKKNDELQKAELQAMCLEDLQGNYSKQMDKLISKNHYLSNELHCTKEKFKTLSVELDNEKKREHVLRNQLKASELLLKDIMVKNKILLQSVCTIQTENNSKVDEQEILLDQYRIYCSKIDTLAKVIDEGKMLNEKKLRLQNRFKSEELLWDRELKILADDRKVKEIEYQKQFNNLKVIHDEVKTLQDKTANTMNTQHRLFEERKNIIKTIIQYEEDIKHKSKITTFVREIFRVIFEEIIHYRFR